MLVNLLGSHANDPYLTIGRYDGLEPGDSFLACSDGLWHYFSNAELGAAIAMNSPRQASEMLIKKHGNVLVGLVITALWPSSNSSRHRKP